MVIRAFPFRSGFPPPSPRRAVGFPLQSLTWVKGASPFGFILRNTGCFPTASAPDHSGRLHGGERAQWWKGQTEHVRPYRSPELRLFAETFRAPSRSKEFPRCLSGSLLTVLSFPNRYHFLSGLCRGCTDIPCLHSNM